MSLQFSTQISPAQVREATAGIFWRQLFQWRLLLGLGALLAMAQGLLWAIVPQAGLLVHGSLCLLLIISGLCLAGFASRYYQALAQRNFVRFEGAPVQVSLDEDAYRFQASWGQGALEWARFDSLWQFSGVWVLLQHRQDGASVLLPSQDLSPQAQAFIRAKLSKGSL